jgi:hypothetical protein
LGFELVFCLELEHGWNLMLDDIIPVWILTWELRGIGQAH